MHLNSQYLFVKHAKHLFKPGMRVLEIGPDDGFLFKKIVDLPSIDWRYLDLTPRNGLTYVATDENKFSLEDNYFDIVFSVSVIEHVRRPWLWIKELARVCKKGGKVLTIAPVSWPYHACPIDCWRIYPEGMRALYADADLSIEKCLFESLDVRHSSRSIPGTGPMDSRKANRMKLLFYKIFHWPQQIAYDIVAIGNKRN